MSSWARSGALAEPRNPVPRSFSHTSEYLYDSGWLRISPAVKRPWPKSAMAAAFFATRA